MNRSEQIELDTCVMLSFGYSSDKLKRSDILWDLRDLLPQLEPDHVSGSLRRLKHYGLIRRYGSTYTYLLTPQGEDLFLDMTNNVDLDDPEIVFAQYLAT